MLKLINLITKKKNYIVLGFTIAYLAAFTLNAILNQNFEFLYYTFLISFFIYLVIVLHINLHLASFILINMSVLGFLHLLGGNLYIGDFRLYDYYFVPGIIKYDNFIHFYASYIGTLALYSLLNNYIGETIKKRYYIFLLILVLMAMGVGTIVEMAEFGAVLVFSASKEVGGYFNNALDLVFNTLGAVLAAIVLFNFRYPPKILQRFYGKN